MKNFKELWYYFTELKIYERSSSKGRLNFGFVLFRKGIRGVWFQLLLLTAIYLIQWIRLSTSPDNFKFTINYIIDTGDTDNDPLSEKDIEDFYNRGRHSRLMQVTIGLSIKGGDHWYSELKQRIAFMAEKYENTTIFGLGIALYGPKSSKSKLEILPQETMKNSVWEIVKEQPAVQKEFGKDFVRLSNMEESLRKQEKVVSMKESKDDTRETSKRPGQYISISKPDKKTKAFIVGDIETILVDDIHVSYAMGYVYAGERGDSILNIKKPITYCTENFYYKGDFKERSRLMFNDFLSGLISYSNRYGTKRVYFHNLSRFDGILLLRLLIEYSSKWIVKPVIREHNIYQVMIYDKRRPKILVLDIRDSLKLLPGSLKSLAEAMCPELGCKGSIPHEELNSLNLSENKEKLIKYLEQDILILGGVLRKAQEKYWDRFHIDITNCLTVSSMSMKIYRTHHYPNACPIYRPDPNQSAFIRRGYYGGHTDVYIPHGKGLFYYDINSLYPYAMTKPMPGGKPVWEGKLQGSNLEPLFGFVEAKVTCPDTIKVPLLPYKDPKNGTLIFPTGTFTGVYFTEELKLAVEIGYKVELKYGYLFEKIESPFSEFVMEIYGERKEAKKKGDQVMSALHKLIMNSLYGRFGIKPECNITEICDQEKLYKLMSICQFSMVEPLNETHYVISYTGALQRLQDHLNKDDVSADKMIHWMDSLRNNSSSAVQISAAITSYARIHMYPYISLPGCHYTDTDSVVLDKPLPDNEISSYELGKLKLEHEVIEGYFLAPKCYALELEGSSSVIRSKGLARDMVDLSWFKEQYKDINRVMKCSIESSFKINWRKLNVYRAKMMLKLGIDPSNKRNLVIDENNRWVDTLPLKISDSSATTRPKTNDQSTIDKPTVSASSKPAVSSCQSEVEIKDKENQDLSSDAVEKIREELKAERSKVEKLREEREELSKELRAERAARENLREEHEELREELRAERAARENLENKFKELEQKVLSNFGNAPEIETFDSEGDKQKVQHIPPFAKTKDEAESKAVSSQPGTKPKLSDTRKLSADKEKDLKARDPPNPK